MGKFKYDIDLYNTRNSDERVGIMKRKRAFQKKNVLHYPRLDTVLMVEDTIRGMREHPTRRQLWLSLPKKTMYQTFKLIIEYLVDSGKIVVKDGKVIWVWDPERVKKYLESELIVK